MDDKTKELMKNALVWTAEDQKRVDRNRLEKELQPLNTLLKQIKLHEKSKKEAVRLARLETLKFVKENCEKEVKALKLQAKAFEDVGAEPINTRAAITGLDIAIEIVDNLITQTENDRNL